jgi:hypothetical protein
MVPAQSPIGGRCQRTLCNHARWTAHLSRDIADNQLSGVLPDSFSLLSELEALYVWLRGCAPPSSAH